MDPGTSLVERLVLLATEHGADGTSDDSAAQSIDLIARQSGIKCHEVERVLVRLEKQNPPLVRRVTRDDGRELWRPADRETEPAEAAAAAAAGAAP